MNRCAAVAAFATLQLMIPFGESRAQESAERLADKAAGATVRSDGMQDKDVDWAALGAAVVERMGLTPGETVLLVGIPGRFDPLYSAIRSHVVDAGAIDLGALSTLGDGPADWATNFVVRAAELRGEALHEHLRRVDLSVMMPGATPADAPYAHLQTLLGEGRGRTIHFHWSGAYREDGTLLPDHAVTDSVYTDALLYTDYAALSAAQTRFENAARAGAIRVTTPAGTDLRFRIGERPMTRQDGDASARRADGARNLIDREIELPAGAIRVAPLEESVAGVVVFPPSLWNGRTVRGLRMVFERGQVVSFTADNDLDAVAEVLEFAGPPARSFREFALGFNPTLRPRGDRGAWIPYYGYGAGVVRLSLGDNTELGGAVGGGYVRWNFFVDATVAVDDVVWVRDGELVAGADE